MTGIREKSNKGEYKITVPQNDLSVVIDDFKIIPAMGLGSAEQLAKGLKAAIDQTGKKQSQSMDMSMH